MNLCNKLFWNMIRFVTTSSVLQINKNEWMLKWIYCDMDVYGHETAHILKINWQKNKTKFYFNLTVEKINVFEFYGS